MIESKKYVKSEGIKLDSAKSYGNTSKRDRDVHVCMQVEPEYAEGNHTH
jgi:hypothetical protein